MRCLLLATFLLALLCCTVLGQEGHQDNSSGHGSDGDSKGSDPNATTGSSPPPTNAIAGFPQTASTTEGHHTGNSILIIIFAITGAVACCIIVALAICITRRFRQAKLLQRQLTMAIEDPEHPGSPSCVRGIPLQYGSPASRLRTFGRVAPPASPYVMGTVQPPATIPSAPMHSTNAQPSTTPGVGLYRPPASATVPSATIHSSHAQPLITGLYRPPALTTDAVSSVAVEGPLVADGTSLDDGASRSRASLLGGSYACTFDDDDDAEPEEAV